MANDDRFLARAVELAAAGSERGDGGPFGAVIVRAGEIVGEGWNRVVAGKDPTAHAEIGAIRAACAALASFHLPGCTLYASSEPCPMCLAAAYWARIERIVFANSRAEAAAIGFCDDDLYQRTGPRPRRPPHRHGTPPAAGGTGTAATLGQRSAADAVLTPAGMRTNAAPPGIPAGCRCASSPLPCHERQVIACQRIGMARPSLQRTMPVPDSPAHCPGVVAAEGG